ncbi:hypothetical protein [Bacillus alkalicellulosilyticus]|uniref:hypothetical protein n=1 Tax=Alkalihalobacterium alkalicellulosilyticum TaxID=1912214 RepID=UPI000996ACFB|nr:hypothetical protein [Bacillus alkalicellulosilyticus]
MSRHEILIVAGFTVIIILNVIMITTVFQMKIIVGSVEYLEHELSSLRSEMSSVHWQLQEQVEQSQWITNSSYTISKVEGVTAFVDIEWNLRELSPSAEVVLFYRDNQSTSWKEVIPNSSPSLSYKVQLEVPLDGNYETKVVAKSEDVIITEPLVELDFASQLKGRIDFDVYVYGEGKENNINIHVYNPLDHNFLVEDSTKLKMKRANATIFVNDSVVETVNLLDYLEENQWNVEEDQDGDALEYSTDEIISFNTTVLLEDNDDIVKIEVHVDDGLGLQYKYIY